MCQRNVNTISDNKATETISENQMCASDNISIHGEIDESVIVEIVEDLGTGGSSVAQKVYDADGNLVVADRTSEIMEIEGKYCISSKKNYKINVDDLLHIVAESSCDNSEMQFPDNASDRELNSDDVDVPVTETVEIDTSKDTSKVAMVYSMNVSK